MSSPNHPEITPAPPATTYKQPPWLLARIMNPLITFGVERIGLSVGGAEILAVRGRKSGEIRKVPVNPLPLDGAWYLFSPRGESAWVRNLRVAGEGELAKGGRVRRFRVVSELPDAQKPPVIRAYMQRWAKQVSSIVGFDANATDETLLAAAPHHPIFRIEIVNDES